MDEAAERRKRLKSMRDAAEATPSSSTGRYTPVHWQRCAHTCMHLAGTRGVRAAAWMPHLGGMAFTGLMLHAEPAAGQHGSFVNPLAAPEPRASLPAPTFSFYRLAPCPSELLSRDVRLPPVE